MNELIKVENKNGELLVSARELHDRLEIETRYNDWFKRMLKYGFEENNDYIPITQKKVTAQGNETTYTDHILKIDCAKEICMIQRTDIGRNVENIFLNVSVNLKKWLILKHSYYLKYIMVVKEVC